jgi:hypothetical protein
MSIAADDASRNDAAARAARRGDGAVRRRTPVAQAFPAVTIP